MDVLLHSDWDCTLEPDEGEQPAIRLGLRMIRGFREEDARRIEAARAAALFRDSSDLCARARLDNRARAQLADAGALQGLAGYRYQARWDVAGIEPQLPLFAAVQDQQEADVLLPVPSVAEDLCTDYATLGTTLGPHRLATASNPSIDALQELPGSH